MLPVFKRSILVLGLAFLLLFAQLGAALVIDDAAFTSIAFADDDDNKKGKDKKDDEKNSLKGNKRLRTAVADLQARVDTIETTGGGGQGSQGPQGPSGADGATGPQGLKGDKGDQGFAGTNGTNGIDGTNGADGATGPQGLKGDKGDQGIQGIQGVAGTNGTNGIDGTNGADGATGPQGLKGDKGDQGIQGIQGIAGTNGTNGIDGTNGTDGATGPEGPTGPAGADGGADSADGVQITSAVFTGQGADLLGDGSISVEVEINGTGFITCDLENPTCVLSFGSNTASVITGSVTDTNMKVYVPLLTSGMYLVTLSNDAGASEFPISIPPMTGAFNISKTISGDFRAGFDTVLVGCPLGSTLLSGGYSTDPATDAATIVVLFNGPAEEDTWQVGGFTQPFDAGVSSPVTIKVTARCMWFGQAGVAVPDPSVP